MGITANTAITMKICLLLLASIVANALADDDSYVTLVKGYIDAGTCDTVSSNDNCGDDATSYYNLFTYNGKYVVISSQVPDHDAESDQLNDNGNRRCERWQFMEIPINPSKGTTATSTSMGTVGLAVTGGAFFNALSSSDGDVAFTNEGVTLDSCFGHSSDVTTTTIKHVSGTYSGLGSMDDDYSYDEDAYEDGSCNLDKANGAVHPTTGDPWVPVYYYGEDGASSLCSAA